MNSTFRTSLTLILKIPKFIQSNLKNKQIRSLTTFPDLPKSKDAQLKVELLTSASKQRIIKKKLKKTNAKPFFDTYKVKSYATADYYNLISLKKALIDSGAYSIVNFVTEMPDNCLCARPKYTELNEREARHAFFFEEGTVVFWNMSSAEQDSILTTLLKHSELFYTQEVIDEESEYLSYSTIQPMLEQEATGESASRQDTRLEKNHIFFRAYNSDDVYECENHLLEKYAFSDAISLSVQLGIWETKLDQFTDKIEYISADLKRGKKLQLEMDEVLQKLGELFMMRHMVNLNSNFLETPDFYWDRDNLEVLYSKLYYHLSISKRTKLFNDRLEHCIDLMQILNQHLNDKKHTRLEWIIIILIAIEACAALGLLGLAKDVINVLYEHMTNK